MDALSELGITPGQMVRVFGLRRSGNHAVINWLTRNAPGRAIFFNNCRSGRSPFSAHSGIEVDGEQVARPGADAGPFANEVGDGATVFVSYENSMPFGERRKPISRGLETGQFSRQVIIARDFLNWLASIVKKVQGNDAFSAHQRVAFILRLIDVYDQMLDLMETAKEHDLVVIRYDQWHDSSAYRRSILDQMGFELRDDVTGKVQSYGNGSSFQPEVTDAKELRPFDRWKGMQDDPEYRIVIGLVAQDRSFVAKLEQAFPESVKPMGDLFARSPYISGKTQG